MSETEQLDPRVKKGLLVGVAVGGAILAGWLLFGCAALRTPLEAAGILEKEQAVAAIESQIAGTTDATILETLQGELAQAQADLALAEEAAAEAQAQGIADVVTTVVPAASPLKPILMPLILFAAGMFSKRWREHFFGAVKQLNPKAMNVPGAWSSLLKMVGFRHTNQV